MILYRLLGMVGGGCTALHCTAFLACSPHLCCNSGRPCTRTIGRLTNASHFYMLQKRLHQAIAAFNGSSNGVLRFQEVGSNCARTAVVKADALRQFNAPRRTSVGYAIAQRDAPGFHPLTRNACVAPPNNNPNDMLEQGPAGNNEREETRHLLNATCRDGVWTFERGVEPAEVPTIQQPTTEVSTAMGRESQR